MRLLPKVAKVVKKQGSLPVLNQFLAAGSPIKMMKNAFYLTLLAPFVPKIFNI